MHKRLEEKNIVPRSIIRMSERKHTHKLRKLQRYERQETESKILMIIYHPHPTLPNQWLLTQFISVYPSRKKHFFMSLCVCVC